jgi:tetratricopeptide (TPR) repeat protein
MGTVYVATDPVLGRSVALKLYLGDLDSPDYRERFAKEARAVAALNHPNIVTVHDYGEFEAQPFIVMELIDGHTLAELDGPIPLDEKLRWLEEICTAVALVHREGIIHRDIKPSNVMIDRAGRVKLLDFGIARVESTPSASLTGPLGSPGYMAPEQIGGGSIDHRADIFAIGAVAYELLASVPAFGGAPFEQIHKILNVPATPLSEIAADLPAELAQAVMRCLSTDPASRFADVGTLGTIVSSIRRRLDVADRDTGITPTVVRPRPRTAPPLGRGRPSSEADSPDPPPATPRPGRETWSRRRAERIAATLREANSYLDRGQLEQARDACEQALTIDETHHEGLALYERVKSALAEREALAFIADAEREMALGELAAAAAFLERARALVPEMPQALRIERDLKLARVGIERTRKRKEMVSDALAASKGALMRGDPETALLHAREALDLEPGHSVALELEESAMQLLNRDVEPTVLVSPPLSDLQVGEPAGVATKRDLPDSSKPPGLKQTESRVDIKPSITSRASTAFHWLESLLAPVTVGPHRRYIWIAMAVAASVVVAVVLTLTRPTSAPVVPAGTLVIDAVPWATITAIVGEDGSAVTLPAVASTPLSLEVPAGTYRVDVQGPPPQEDRRQLEGTVVAGQTLVVPRLEFSPLTTDTYFEPYIASPNDGSKP